TALDLAHLGSAGVGHFEVLVLKACEGGCHECVDLGLAQHAVVHCHLELRHDRVGACFRRVLHARAPVVNSGGALGGEHPGGGERDYGTHEHHHHERRLEGKSVARAGDVGGSRCTRQGWIKAEHGSASEPAMDV